MNGLRRRLLQWGALAAVPAYAAAPRVAALDNPPTPARMPTPTTTPTPTSTTPTPTPPTSTPTRTPTSTTVPTKHLSMRNLHTSEKLDVVFFRGSAYVPDALAAIQVLLRDYRNGEEHSIDPRLMDDLYDLAQSLGRDPVFSVISGYRSPQTNERLRERSDGVARHSLHLEGRAIDVRLAGADCADLAACARQLRRGGVGYYRRSDFVHLDTGAYRTWNG